MRGSFSFCGRAIEDFGLTYAPDASTMYVYAGAQGKSNTQVFDSHAGGYYYGTAVQPKQFDLRCYFENNALNDGLFAKLDSFFRIGKSGRLVFGSRPYIYYNTIVDKIDLSKILNDKNGYVTISLIAYYSYGRTDYKGLEYNYYNNKGIQNINLNGITMTMLSPSSFLLDGRSEGENILLNDIGKSIPNGKYKLNVKGIQDFTYTFGGLQSAGFEAITLEEDAEIEIEVTKKTLGTEIIKAKSNGAWTNHTVEFTLTSLEKDAEMEKNILQNTGMIDESKMPPSINLLKDGELLDGDTILLYNGGTRDAAVAIELQSDCSERIEFVNKTNSTSCAFIRLNEAAEKFDDKFIVCDALNGSTCLTDGSTATLAPLYHDGGFITLRPGDPKRNITVKWKGIEEEVLDPETGEPMKDKTTGEVITVKKTNTITCDDGLFDEDDLGRFIHIDGKWNKILAVEDTEMIEVEDAVSDDGNETTDIVTMNEIEMRCIEEPNLTRLGFVYKHTFA